MAGPSNTGNCNIATKKKIHWADFGKQTLTTVGRSIILKGMVTSHFNNVMCVCAGEQLTDKHINFAQNLVSSKYTVRMFMVGSQP